MAWLGITGSFIDAPAEAARRTDFVLHSTWQWPSCQYFRQLCMNMGDFHALGFCHLSGILVFMCLTSYHCTVHMTLSLPPQDPIFSLACLSPHFMSPGWFPSGCSSFSTTVQLCESENNCLTFATFRSHSASWWQESLRENKRERWGGGMPTDVSS